MTASTPPSMPGGRDASRPGVTAAAAVLVMLALGAGLIEGGVRLFQHFGRGELIRMPLDIVWMAPLVDLAWLLLLGLLLLPLRALLPRLLTSARVTGILAAGAALPVILLVTSLHKGVALLLAVGIGLQVSRLAERHADRIGRVARVAAPILVVVTVLAAVLVIGAERRAERRAIAARPAGQGYHPNVLLIVWDTVRDKSLSVSGYTRPTTPFLERFSRDGVRFSNALATAPWTFPSHISMLTATWPYEFYQGMTHPPLHPGPSLATILASAGYATAGFVGNLAYTTREHELDRGFEHYEDYERTLRTAVAYARLTTVLFDQRWFREAIGYGNLVWRKPAATVNRHFLEWLDQRQDDAPFFVFLNYFDAHQPYLPPSPYRERFVKDPAVPYRMEWAPTPPSELKPGQIEWTRDNYDALIAYLDDQTRSLLEELGRRGVLDSTIVIVTSDHGEQFGEHGRIAHMNTIWRQALEVPFLLRYPAAVPRGMVVDAPVSLRDIPRTVLTLAGVDSAGRMAGRSLTRFWDGTPPSGDSLLLSELSVMPKERIGPHALVANGFRYLRPGMEPDSVLLFGFVEDPEEDRSVHASPAAAPALAYFRHLSDSLAAEYKRTHRAGATSTGSSDDRSDN